jgi:membrane-bound lytic murein transglycosylase MltF
MTQPTLSQEDADSYRTYLEGYTTDARDRVIRSFQSVVERLKQYDQQAKDRPEYTWQAHEDMQRTILWMVHNSDLTYLLRTAASLAAWDQQHPRLREEAVDAIAG